MAGWAGRCFGLTTRKRHRTLAWRRSMARPCKPARCRWSSSLTQLAMPRADWRLGTPRSSRWSERLPHEIGNRIGPIGLRRIGLHRIPRGRSRQAMASRRPPGTTPRFVFAREGNRIATRPGTQQKHDDPESCIIGQGCMRTFPTDGAVSGTVGSIPRAAGDGWCYRRNESCRNSRPIEAQPSAFI